MSGVCIRPATTLGRTPSHARHDNHHARALETINLIEQPVDPGHSHVEDRVHGAPHRHRGHFGFFRNRDIRGAGGDDHDVALKGVGSGRLNHHDSRRLMIHRFPAHSFERTRDGGIGACRKHRLFVFEQAPGKRDDLLLGFPFTENHLR